MSVFDQNHLLENLNIIIFGVEITTLQINFLNNSFKKVFPLISKNLSIFHWINQYILPKDQEKIINFWKNYNQDLQVCETEFQTQDEQLFHQICKINHDLDGKKFFLCELQDFTQQKQLHSQLNKVTIINDMIFKHFPLSVELYNKEGTIIKASDPHFILYGQKRGDPKTDSIIKQYNPLKDPFIMKNPSYKALLDSLYRGNVVSAPPFQFKSRDGIDRFQDDLEPWIRPTLIPITINNELENFIIVNEDMTEYNHLKNQLEECTYKLESVLNEIVEGIVFINIDEQILMINKKAENILGISSVQLEGKNINTELIFFSDPERHRIKFSVKNEPLYNMKSIFISRTGSELYLEYSYIPLINSKISIGAVLFFSDKTNQQKMELNNYRMQKLESLGLLAGGIAHDFNNLLTIISGNISLLKMDLPENTENSSYIENSEYAVKKAQILTNQLLTFAKGGAPLKEVSYITSVIVDTTEFTLRGTDFTPNYKFQSNIWPIEMDRGQISQVIQNILLNAIQSFPKQRTIDITVENINITEENLLKLSNGQYVKIIFRDYGIGIEKEKLHIIFDPYYTTKPSQNGLGLTISHSIIQKHKGIIQVDSQIGIGTTVTLYLPANTTNSIKNELKDEAETPHKIISTPIRILVLEDEPQINLLFKKLAERMDMKIMVTTDGQETIKMYKTYFSEKNPFHLVILDLTIKGGQGGEETFRELREYDRDIKAIVTSGYSANQLMAEYEKFGFKARLSKPFSYYEFKAALNKALNV